MLCGVTLAICIQVLVSLISSGCTGATATNRTIDDEFGDPVTGKKPVFLPTSPGIWEGEACTGCPFHPDKDLAFKGTWNTATFRNEVPGGSGPISIDLEFKGTAIYVFLITGNQISQGFVTTLTECNFTLDGQHADFFQRTPDQTTDMNYNVLAFKRENLPNIDHSLRVSTGGVNYHVLLSFDYAIYTFDDEQEPITSPSLSHSTSASSSTTSSSSITTAGNSSTTSTISSTIRSDSSTVSGNVAPSSTSAVVIENSIAPQSFSPTPTVTPILTNNKKVPLSMILGGTIGGLALVLIVIILLCIYGRRRRQRRELAAASVVQPSAQVPDRPPISVFRDPRAPSMHKGVPSRIRSPPQLLENYDVKVQRYINNSNPSGTSQYMFSKSNSGPSYTETGSNNESTPASSSANGASEELRTRQIDLERRFLDAQQRLRDAGIAPRLGPGPMPHVEPPPEYSAD